MNFLVRFFLAFLGLFFIKISVAQVCTSLGQTPETAFPVCGTVSFNQQSVPICSSTSLFVPGCTGGANSANYENKNPYWYKFTCYASGTLSFTINPANAGDDYDWQLYDVTGLDPSAVLTNRNIIVTGNWSGSSGSTGASAAGVNFIQCASDPAANAPRFARSPNLIAGHNYILLVSHFTDSQSGYSLSFGGGTANITDPLDPRLLSANAPCDGTEIRIRTNKKMKCNSLAANGSDFEVISPTGVVLNPTSASALQCSGGFDLDSISLFMPAPLAPGTYKVKAKNGTDANTLRDNCDRNIPVGDSVSFTVFPLFPTPMDSITPLKCAPQTLEIVFKKRIKCSTIAADGSDFFITGPYPVSITNATTSCTNGETNKIILQLSAPLQVAGNFLVNLQTGTDGNTLFDECNVQSVLPDDAAFVVKDTVNANFNANINLACAQNTVNYTHNGANAVNSWNWTFASTPFTSALQNPTVIYSKRIANTTTSLIVTNGVCNDTASLDLVFDNFLKANFDVPDYICPNKPLEFTNTTVGTIVNWSWTFGNGNTSTAQTPNSQFYTPLQFADFTVSPQLIATNNYGCTDTILKNVQILFSCFISVPTAFTPNGDGLNDFLSPIRKFNGSNLQFSVYNRFGQRIFYATDWNSRWNGKFKGIDQPPGTYVWTLDYFNLEAKKQFFEKGTTVLIR
jgi:gliding motility-associated-like protein